MAIEGDTRYRLHQVFVELIGTDMATALLESFPPEGWSDVLRHDDLAKLEQRMDQRFERIDQRFERIDERFERVDVQFKELEQRFDLKLEAAEHRIRADFHHEFGLLRQEFAVQTRTLLLGVSGLMLTICVMVFGAAKLL